MDFSFSSFFEHILPSSWFESLSDSQGFDFSHEEVTQSVHDASDFFHIDDPLVVKEGWTTGVYPKLTLTESDDVLIYNRQQMEDMGIIEKDAFDLIMTHEGTHRMLQGLNTGFNSHQEELCCDYMAGVRAGLNSMDVSQMENSLAHSHASSTHPDGQLRVEAIEKGVAFAEQFYSEHGVPPTFTECIEHYSHDMLGDHVLGWVTLRPEGTPAEPQLSSFDDERGEPKMYSQEEINAHKTHAEHEMRVQESYMRYHQKIAASKARMGEPHETSDHQFNVAKDKYDSAKQEYQKWSNMKPDVKCYAGDFASEEATEMSQMSNMEVHEFHHGGQYGNATGDYIDDSHPVDGEHGELKGWIDNRATHLQWAKEAKENAEWYEKRSKDAIERGDISAAKSYADTAAMYRRQERDEIAASKKCTK